MVPKNTGPALVSSSTATALQFDRHVTLSEASEDFTVIQTPATSDASDAAQQNPTESSSAIAFLKALITKQAEQWRRKKNTDVMMKGDLDVVSKSAEEMGKNLEELKLEGEKERRKPVGQIDEKDYLIGKLTRKVEVKAEKPNLPAPNYHTDSSLAARQFVTGLTLHAGGLCLYNIYGA